MIKINVFHEIGNKGPIMMDIYEILKSGGELIIMEPMARKQGERHANCKHLRLYEPEFLKEMNSYRFNLNRKETGEKISNLIYYTFDLNKL